MGTQTQTTTELLKIQEEYEEALHILGLDNMVEGESWTPWKRLQKAWAVTVKTVELMNINLLNERHFADSHYIGRQSVDSVKSVLAYRPTIDQDYLQYGKFLRNMSS